MKKLISVAFMLGMLLVVAMPATAQTANDQYNDSPGNETRTVRTTITSIDRSFIGVENPNYPEKSPSATVSFFVDGGTQIVWQDGSPAAFGDLRVGQRIELTFTGPLVDCPPDVACVAMLNTANKIVILEEAAEGDPAPPSTMPTTDDDSEAASSDSTATGGSAGEASAEQSTSESELEVLPDTGGLVSPILGIGALLIAGGCLTRRMFG